MPSVGCASSATPEFVNVIHSYVDHIEYGVVQSTRYLQATEFNSAAIKHAAVYLA